jgi:putative hydrolase of the HAD superfamily
MQVELKGYSYLCLMQLSRYTTLIFDLGGVIINLNTQSTVEAFMGHNPTLTPAILHHPLALEYEMGLITDDEFRHHVRSLVDGDLSDEDIDSCWNAMILDIPSWRIDLLKKLRNKHTLFLLSNTNYIHMRQVEKEVGKHGILSLDDLFDKSYYSHKMNMRKPNTDIYEQIIRENDLQPDKTLFIDDNPYNIAGAKQTGLHTVHLTDPEQLRDFFHG